MSSEHRRRHMASLVAIRGRVTVSELAAYFDVTAETIRRDLATLEAAGELYRMHGGAVAAHSFRNASPTLEERSQASIQAKRAIGRAALTCLPHGPCTIFLDAGTTTAIMADALVAHQHTAAQSDCAHELEIITNSLPIATALVEAPGCDVRLVGGHVRPESQAIVGDIATRAIGMLRADIAFVGTNAITMQHGLSTPDAQEGAIKRAMVTNAHQVVALCDSTKFGLDYLVSFASINDLECIVTDTDAPSSYIDDLRDAGVGVVFATL